MIAAGTKDIQGESARNRKKNTVSYKHYPLSFILENNEIIYDNS